LVNKYDASEVFTIGKNGIIYGADKKVLFYLIKKLRTGFKPVIMKNLNKKSKWTFYDKIILNKIVILS